MSVLRKVSSILETSFSIEKISFQTLHSDVGYKCVKIHVVVPNVMYIYTYIYITKPTANIDREYFLFCFIVVLL